MRWMGFPILLVASTVWADFSGSHRFDTADVRAMGGVSNASGSPAVAAMDDRGFGITVLAIDIRGSLSEGIAGYRWAMDVKDLMCGMGNLEDRGNLLTKRDKLAALAAGVPSALDAQGRVDIARFQFGNRRFGQFLFGAYAEWFVGARFSMPSPDRIGVSGMTISLSKASTPFQAAGMGDAGGRIGYGRLFRLPRGMSLAGGIHGRIFNRWIVDPYRIGLDATVSGSGSLRVPEFSYGTGVGGAVDLSSLLAANDRVLDARIGLEVNGIGATGYSTGVARETMDFAVGGTVKPLRSIGIRWWETGIEIHAYEDGRTSLHFGMAWPFGGRWLNISPRIGGIVGDRMVFGEARNVLTGGFSATLGFFQIAAVCELSQYGYDTGLRLALGNL
jgi:hypothetical protein